MGIREGKDETIHFRDEINKTIMEYYEICNAIVKCSSHAFSLFHDFQHQRTERCVFDFKPEFNVGFIRHDIDHDPFVALAMARIEAEHGIRSSYFFLTNDSMTFHFEDPDRRRKALDAIAEIASLGHEVGLHYDCVGEFLATGKPFAESIAEPLAWFRDHGIEINGCVAHGASRIRKLTGRDTFPLELCNYQIWQETNPEPCEFEENGKRFSLPNMSLADFGLKYEPYFVRKDRYLSDSGGLLWRTWNKQHQPFENINESSGLDLSKWLDNPACKNEVLQILIHPIWWVRSLGVEDFYYYGKVRPLNHILADRVYRTW